MNPSRAVLLGVNETDANRQFPAVPAPVQPAGHADLDQVSVVLPKPPDAEVGEPSSHEEGLADGGGETLDENAGDVGGDEQVRVPVIGRHSGTQLRRVEPGRRDGDPFEELSQRRRSLPENVFPSLHPGLNEPMRFGLVERGQRLDHGVGGRVADKGVLHIVDRRFPVIDPGLFVPGPIGGRRAVGKPSSHGALAIPPPAEIRAATPRLAKSRNTGLRLIDGARASGYDSLGGAGQRIGSGRRRPKTERRAPVATDAKKAIVVGADAAAASLPGSRKIMSRRRPGHRLNIARESRENPVVTIHNNC